MYTTEFNSRLIVKERFRGLVLEKAETPPVIYPALSLL
jgi:hypothetical protein